MNIDVDNSFVSSEDLVNEIKTKLSSMDDLQEIKENNHNLYYKIDETFLKAVDKKYQKEAKLILEKIKKIDPDSIFKNNMNESIKLKNELLNINKAFFKLKEKVKKDLLGVIDYVDNAFEMLDVSNVTKSTPLGILVLNKYSALQIYSANIDTKDINYAMKQQSKRLLYIQELRDLIFEYNNTITIYNRDNSLVLLDNLYTILGDYIHLLTVSEQQYTTEAIKKILSYKFDFIDKYIHTYKIILNKIWISKHTSKYYFIRNIDLKDNNIYVMTENNKDKYPKKGYICNVPKNFIDYFNLSNLDVLKLPLIDNIDDKFKLNIDDEIKKDIKIKAIYSMDKNNDSESILPIICIK